MNETQEHDELEDILYAISNRPIPENSTQFTIDTIEMAAWAGRKILKAEKQIEELEGLRKTYTDAIDTWFSKAAKPHLDSWNYLRIILRPYVETEVRKQRKSKTLQLPGIAISLRKSPDRAVIQDEGKALSYCEKHLPKAIEIKKSLSKAILKETIISGGSVPGVDLETGMEELYFKGDSSLANRKEAYNAA